MSDDGGLRGLFRDNLPRFHWQSVETGMTGRGVPDSNFCAPPGIEGWVEFKQTEEWAVTLRPEQVGWLCRRARAGGRVFVAVRRWPAASRRREAADELWLLAGAAARELLDYGLPGGPRCPLDASRLPPGAFLSVWPGGPARWDWDAVAVTLTS